MTARELAKKILDLDNGQLDAEVVVPNKAGMWSICDQIEFKTAVPQDGFVRGMPMLQMKPVWN